VSLFVGWKVMLCNRCSVGWLCWILLSWVSYGARFELLVRVVF